MERLPYIDEHTTIVAADQEATWSALIAVLRGTDQPMWRSYARLVGCEPAQARGDWGDRGVRAGATVPGFAVAQAKSANRLVLKGRHRFARYELTFVLEPAEPSAIATRLRAETRAVFPGISGGLYRALVIASGAHVVATRRLLWLVARLAVRGRGREAGPPAGARACNVACTPLCDQEAEHGQPHGQFDGRDQRSHRPGVGAGRSGRRSA